MGVNGIYGLSGSGIDIESMVKVGMMGKQKEYDKMQQSYTKNEWKKQAYNDIYSSIQTFNNSTLSQYKLQSTMNAKAAKSSDESIVTATANGSAPLVNHKITVNSLSSNSYLLSTNKLDRINGGATSDSSIYMKDVLFKSAKVDSSDSSKANITFADGTTAKVNLTDTAFELKVGDGTTNSNGTEKTGTIKYTYDDLLNSSKSFNDFTSDLNALGLNAKASYDSVNDSFSFYNNEGGAANKINLQFTDGQAKATTSEFIKNMKLYQSKDGTLYDRKGNAISDTNPLSTNEDYFGISANTVSATSAALVSTAGKLARTAVTTVDMTASGGSTTVTDSSISDPASNKIKDILFSEISQTQKVIGQNSNGTNKYNYDFVAKYNDDVGVSTALTAASFQNLQNTVAFGFTVSDGTNTIELSYNYQDLIYNNGGMTFEQLADDINTKAAAAGLNITASYSYDDENGDVFKIANSATGSTSGITIGQASDATAASKQVTSYLFNSMKMYQTSNEVTTRDGAQISDVNVLYDSEGNAVSNADLSSNDNYFKLTSNGTISVSGADEYKYDTSTAVSVAGTDGSVTIDGVDYTTTSDKVTASGITYTINTTGTSNIKVTQDTDAVIDKVKSFVEDYNKLLSSLYEKYDEKVYSDYKPLTASQKDSMKEEQVEKWEEKAKSGLLYHDETLSKLIYAMRDAVSTPVEGVSGKYNSVFALGISTTGTKGQLTLDEDKLRAALNEEPDSVYNVFGRLDANDTSNFDKSGVAQRLGDVFTSGMKNIRSRAGTDSSVNDDSDLGKLMRELQNKMSNFKRLMDSFETKLYKKYDAMEVGLTRLGMQLGFITGGQ